MRAAPRATTFLIGSVFLLASLAKSASPRATIASLAPVFGGKAAFPMLAALLVFEIALGAVLVAGIARRMALASTCIAAVGFSAWIVYLILTGAHTSCGCGFGTSGVAWSDLWRPGGLLLFGLVALALNRRA